MWCLTTNWNTRATCSKWDEDKATCLFSNLVCNSYSSRQVQRAFGWEWQGEERDHIHKSTGEWRGRSETLCTGMACWGFQVKLSRLVNTTINLFLCAPNVGNYLRQALAHRWGCWRWSCPHSCCKRPVGLHRSQDQCWRTLGLWSAIYQLGQMLVPSPNQNLGMETELWHHIA